MNLEQVKVGAIGNFLELVAPPPGRMLSRRSRSKKKRRRKNLAREDFPAGWRQRREKRR